MTITDLIKWAAMPEAHEPPEIEDVPLPVGPAEITKNVKGVSQAADMSKLNQAMRPTLPEGVEVPWQAGTFKGLAQGLTGNADFSQYHPLLSMLAGKPQG